MKQPKQKEYSFWNAADLREAMPRILNESCKTVEWTLITVEFGGKGRFWGRDHSPQWLSSKYEEFGRWQWESRQSHIK